MNVLTCNVAEAARRLGVGRVAVYRAIRSGQIPTLRLGRNIRIPISALERMCLVDVGREEVRR
jgi:excisionase family DNA binding protein